MQILIIFTFAANDSLLSEKNDLKYTADFYIFEESLKHFQNKKEAEKSIRNLLLGSYNEVWDIFESNMEKIKDEEIRAAIELFRLKLLTYKKKMILIFDFEPGYVDYHKAKREPGFFTIQKLRDESQDGNGESDNRIDSEDEKQRVEAEIAILNGLGDYTLRNLKYLDPDTECEYKCMLQHYRCFKDGYENYPPYPWVWDNNNEKHSILATVFHEIVHLAL